MISSNLIRDLRRSKKDLQSQYGLRLVRAADAEHEKYGWFLEYNAPARGFYMNAGDFRMFVPLRTHPADLGHGDLLVFN